MEQPSPQPFIHIRSFTSHLRTKALINWKAAADFQTCALAALQERILLDTKLKEEQ